MIDIALDGCTPEPLMNYLKALGIFRLIAEQHPDADARLSWRGGVAHLKSKLDREALIEFFTNQYCPTPIIVPWSGGDFFGINPDGDAGPYRKCPTATCVIGAFLASTSERLLPYRMVIKQVIQAMHDCDIQKKADIEGAGNKGIKARFISTLRNRLPEEVVGWIDAAAQPEDGATTFNPLLGSGGGNDGNTHFSDNFMQNLWDCLPDFDEQRLKVSVKPSLAHALFNELSGQLTDRTSALYDSGAVGGPNATQGFKREFLVNPWNFIFAIEGLLTFAGGLAKKAGSQRMAASTFPFLVRMSAAGSDFCSAAVKEYGQYEVWLPLWIRYAAYPEILLFFREARAQVGRRSARNGVDMARAVSTKGVSAGIEEFRRYGLIRGRVGGENYFTAAAIGRYRVRYDSSVTLLEQLDPWLLKFDAAIRDEKVPARYRSQFQLLDRKLADYCRSDGTAGSLIRVLEELGRTERLLSSGQMFCKKNGIRPLQGLSAAWLDRGNDDSMEFRLAAALAGIRADRDIVGPFRAFLESVEFVGKYANWSPGSTSAVWSNRPLAANLAEVFRRRQMEAFRNGQNGVPLRSKIFAPLVDVSAFLHAEIDEDKLTALLWALPAIDWPSVDWMPPKSDSGNPCKVPFEFGLPRLLVQPLSLHPAAGGDGKTYWRTSGSATQPTEPDPDVFHLLATPQPGAIGRATTHAARRLKSSGVTANGYRSRQFSGTSLAVMSNIPPERLLAAMLFPLSDRDLETIAKQVLYPPETEE